MGIFFFKKYIFALFFFPLVEVWVLRMRMLFNLINGELKFQTLVSRGRRLTIYDD